MRPCRLGSGALLRSDTGALNLGHWRNSDALCFARASALALIIPALATPAQAADSGEVNVYSYRQPYLIEPLLKEFTDETGIKVNVIFAEKGLIERIQAEGRNSPADVLLTVDIGNLTQAKTAGIAQPVQSEALDAAVPPPIAPKTTNGSGSRAAPV